MTLPKPGTPEYETLRKKAKTELDSTGKINGDTFAALMGAEPVTNPTPRQKAILGAAAILPQPDTE